MIVVENLRSHNQEPTYNLQATYITDKASNAVTVNPVFCHASTQHGRGGSSLKLLKKIPPEVSSLKNNVDYGTTLAKNSSIDALCGADHEK